MLVNPRSTKHAIIREGRMLLTSTVERVKRDADKQTTAGRQTGEQTKVIGTALTLTSVWCRTAAAALSQQLYTVARQQLNLNTTNRRQNKLTV